MAVTNSILARNTITGNYVGVMFRDLGDNSSRVRLAGNAIHGNQQLGIALTDNIEVLPTLNDIGDFDNGPNTLLNFPVIGRAVADGQALMAEVSLDTSPGIRAYTIEFFASRAAGVTGFGEGERYLGTASASTDISGRAFVTFSAAAVSPGEYLTATTTDAEGNTSEFSSAVLIQGPEDLDEDGISEAVEIQVPNGVGGASVGGGSAPGTRDGLQPHGPDPTGDGNGDGLPDAQQAHVTSFPGLSGQWLTLATRAGVALREVSPSGPPNFSALPAGYTFPLGFVSLTLSNVPPGGAVLLTNVLHGEIALTTAFAYGPTPDQPQPHWYELSPTIVGGQIRLTFTDGAAGDHDLAANGAITTIYAPAWLVPPGPTLTLLSCQTALTDEIDLVEVNGEVVLVTNQVPLVTGVFAWPASATNYVLEHTDALSPTNRWQAVFDAPVVLDNQRLLTNTAVGATHFYRLRRY